MKDNKEIKAEEALKDNELDTVAGGSFGEPALHIYKLPKDEETYMLANGTDPRQKLEPVPCINYNYRLGNDVDI